LAALMMLARTGTQSSMNSTVPLVQRHKQKHLNSKFNKNICEECPQKKKSA
jgi:hypothetical protein